MPKNFNNNQLNFLEEDEVSRDFSMDEEMEYDEYEEYDNNEEQVVEERDFETELNVPEKQKKSSMVINTFNAMLGKPTEYTDMDYKLRTSKKGQVMFMVLATLLLLGIFALFIVFRR